jgi:hypothetical protein
MGIQKVVGTRNYPKNKLLKSRKFGKMAANLVNDLGLLDEEIGKGKSADVEALVKEVAALLG